MTGTRQQQDEARTIILREKQYDLVTTTLTLLLNYLSFYSIPGERISWKLRLQFNWPKPYELFVHLTI